MQCIVLNLSKKEVCGMKANLQKRNIAVFCGSDMGKKTAFCEAAEELGKWIGKNKDVLIYGGGDAGLMGVVSKNAYQAGSKVIGVVPKNVDFMKKRSQEYVTTLIETSDMSERKQKMMDIADVFIALPGGIGTLDEMSEAITMTKIGAFHKPCIFFNKDDYYAPLKRMFDEMEQAGFWWKDSRKHVLFSENFEEIERFITTEDRK